MADEYLYGMHPYLRNDSRVQRLGARGPYGVPGGVDPKGLGSSGSPSMPVAAMPVSEPYNLSRMSGSQSVNAADALQNFGQAVNKRFARVAYTEQTRFNPNTKVKHLAEDPKLNTTVPTRRINQTMRNADMMQSSATTRSVPETDNLVQKIVAEKEAISAQKRRIQIAADLEREATSLEQTAVKLANKGIQIPEGIPDVVVSVGSSNTMNTALVLGAIAIGVLAVAAFARR